MVKYFDFDLNCDVMSDAEINTFYFTSRKFPWLPIVQTELWQISTRSRACKGCFSPRARRALPNVQVCTPKLRRAQGFQAGSGAGRLTKAKHGVST